MASSANNSEFGNIPEYSAEEWDQIMQEVEKYENGELGEENYVEIGTNEGEENGESDPQYNMLLAVLQNNGDRLHILPMWSHSNSRQAQRTHCRTLPPH